MPSSKNFKNFVLEHLTALNNITCKPMMGEFLLYHNDILFGGIYDDSLLIKKTNSNKVYLLKEEFPYKTAKPMFMVENLDDTKYICELIIKTCKDLKK